MNLPQVTGIERLGANELVLRLALPADMQAFTGHFPGNPILPGVVQIDWAARFGVQYLELPQPAARRFQVKFRQIITPGKALDLLLKNDPERGKLSFTYRVADQIKASGNIAWGMV